MKNEERDREKGKTEERQREMRKREKEGEERREKERRRIETRREREKGQMSERCGQGGVGPALLHPAPYWVIRHRPVTLWSLSSWRQVLQAHAQHTLTTPHYTPRHAN